MAHSQRYGDDTSYLLVSDVKQEIEDDDYNVEAEVGNKPRSETEEPIYLETSQCTDKMKQNQTQTT